MIPRATILELLRSTPEPEGAQDCLFLQGEMLFVYGYVFMCVCKCVDAHVSRSRYAHACGDHRKMSGVDP